MAKFVVSGAKKVGSVAKNVGDKVILQPFTYTVRIVDKYAGLALAGVGAASLGLVAYSCITKTPIGISYIPGTPAAIVTQASPEVTGTPSPLETMAAESQSTPSPAPAPTPTPALSPIAAPAAQISAAPVYTQSPAAQTASPTAGLVGSATPAVTATPTPTSTPIATATPVAAGEKSPVFAEGKDGVRYAVKYESASDVEQIANAKSVRMTYDAFKALVGLDAGLVDAYKTKPVLDNPVGVFYKLLGPGGRFVQSLYNNTHTARDVFPPVMSLEDLMELVDGRFKTISPTEANLELAGKDNKNVYPVWITSEEQAGKSVYVVVFNIVDPRGVEHLFKFTPGTALDVDYGFRPAEGLAELVKALPSGEQGAVLQGTYVETLREPMGAQG